jgi:hypothetical protein
MPSSLGESFGSAVAVTYVPALPTIGRIVARYQDQGNVKHASTVVPGWREGRRVLHRFGDSETQQLALAVNNRKMLT